MESIQDPKKITKNECDSLLDLLIIAYAFGVENVNRSIDTDIKVSRDKMSDSIYAKIDGKTWEERIFDYDSIEQLRILAENESNRAFSDGQWDCANDTGLELLKTWNDMEDDKVRESHFFLGGTTIPLNEYFRTLNGSETLYPRRFGLPEEDINCRCWLTYSRRGEVDE